MKTYRMIAAVLCGCLMLTGCGGAKEPASQTTAPSAERLKVEECYGFHENDDGTYAYVVRDRSGITLFADYDSIRPVEFAVANEDVLVVHGQAGVGVGARWAVFCDVEHSRVSECFAGYLGSTKNRVAFVEQRTDAYHVFVCDPYNSAVYTSVTTLEGLVMDTDILKDFAMGEDGMLSVTYGTADGDKTVQIDLNAEED